MRRWLQAGLQAAERWLGYSRLQGYGLKILGIFHTESGLYVFTKGIPKNHQLIDAQQVSFPKAIEP
jgi:hypothetical protein